MRRISPREYDPWLAFVVAFLLLRAIAPSRFDRLTSFSYSHRPAGYHWTKWQSTPQAPIVYYGSDPKTHHTVYVGLDGTYYTFSHSPPITPRDLRAIWNPHDAESH
jgi:hypothetical protein